MKLNLKETGRGDGCRATAKEGRAGLLRLLGIALTGGLLSLCSAGLSAQENQGVLLQTDEAFLQEIEARSVLFFLDHTDPLTGLTRDRAPADGRPSAAYASVAASGFALTAWCIAADRGWLPRETARRQSMLTLDFLLNRAEHVRGWFYHFLHVGDGTRAWRSEASTIDTALLMQGALVAREYFKDPEITGLVDALYARIDWNWALNGGFTLSHGWRPETGFIPWRWDQYAEMLGLYLLGLGAPERPLPPSSWHSWRRGPIMEYAGRSYMHCAPLFTHQFSHAWFDFRGRQDAYADYWRNSVDATLAQRQWCADQSASFPHWSLDLWGLTASDSAKGYVAWGGPNLSPEKHDGTLVPCAPGGSLPFAPAECLNTLRRMRELGGDQLWGRYGFADAFNPHTNWVASDVIAIDQGIMLLMSENLRSGFVWRMFMQAPEVRRALELAGFRDQRDMAGGTMVAHLR